ncbi:hypothetical protein A9Q89_04870 [Gammaproteobacteria bacterium 53_120_T64]|nr:hypothetical protein A9Q89_04870 [Gammaproteobacteria bacterium 53_120_T64]
MRISKDLKKWAVYSLAGLFSLALHGVVVFLLLLGGAEKSTTQKPRPANFVRATLVQLQPKVPVRDQRAAKEKAAVAKKRAEQRRQEQVRKQKAAERKQREQKKQRAEKNRRDKALKKKQADARAQQAAEQKQQVAREQRAREAERQQELQREARAQALASALDSEDEFLADEESGSLVQGYQQYIQQRIIANWNRPLSARRGMETILSIQLVPTGQVVGVTVLKSSGNPAFDLSAQQAVKKVGRFDKLQQLSQQSPRLFERSFRQFQLVFRPEDLRL